MPKFRLTQATFLAPDLLPEGAIIDYDGPLGPQFAAVDEEGEVALSAYYSSNPHAAIGPVDSLILQGGSPGEQAPTGTLAQPGKATPGPSDGGAALDIK